MGDVHDMAAAQKTPPSSPLDPIAAVPAPTPLAAPAPKRPSVKPGTNKPEPLLLFKGSKQQL